MSTLENPFTRYQLVSTGKKQVSIPTDTTDISWATKQFDNDRLFEDLTGLVNPDFRAWYCKAFYLLGVPRVLELAAVARADGRQPGKLFSKLLKVELGKKS